MDFSGVFIIAAFIFAVYCLLVRPYLYFRDVIRRLDNPTFKSVMKQWFIDYSDNLEKLRER